MLAPACAILEAILFASGDPIPLSRLAAASGIPERELPQLLNDLNTAYQNPDTLCKCCCWRKPLSSVP